MSKRQKNFMALSLGFGCTSKNSRCPYHRNSMRFTAHNRRIDLPRMGGGFQRLRILPELLHHGFRRPAIRTLAWRELNHGLHILRDERARRQQHKDSIGTPLFIEQIAGYIRLLERIGAKVEELRKLQR